MFFRLSLIVQRFATNKKTKTKKVQAREKGLHFFYSYKTKSKKVNTRTHARRKHARTHEKTFKKSILYVYANRRYSKPKKIAKKCRFFPSYQHSYKHSYPQ